MKIFKEVFTNDEIGSDSYPMKTVECVYEFEGKFVNKETGGNFDIGANDVEGCEQYENSQVKVINFVEACRLQKIEFSKKDYVTYIKGYMKKLKSHLEEKNKERVAAFQTEAQNFVKKIITDFDKYEFYSGESCDPEAMVILSFYGEDQTTPYFYLWKDGLIGEQKRFEKQKDEIFREKIESNAVLCFTPFPQ